MNEDTLVTVHCYRGDQKQVENALPVNLRHECPVLILSPEDAPVRIDHPQVTCRSGGKAAYFGQDSLDRQLIHMRMMLETPYRYFLMNDADSMCLSARIPDYLYERAYNTVWSNVVRESRPHPSPYPKVAFHPPYFMERETIEKLLAVGPRIKAHEITPFIDWQMVAMTCEAGVEYQSFPDGRSFAAWRHGKIPETKLLGHNFVHDQLVTGGVDGGGRMQQFVEQGVVMVHSVKHKKVLNRLVAAHERFELLGSPTLPAREPKFSGISLLVPFREDSTGTRTATWRWLEQYYRKHLPEAEIVIGNDDGMPYSKSVAINDAASRAQGYILVILDADTLINPALIHQAASTIERAERPVWFLPFKRAYRLTRERSAVIQSGDPTREIDYMIPGRDMIEDQIDNPPGFVQVLSRRAFDKVGGMDPRFRGWGGEDSSFVRAVDTLYSTHRRYPDHVLHLWHERPGAGSSSTRRWDGQTERIRDLTRRYKRATGDPIEMRALVDEGLGG